MRSFSLAVVAAVAIATPAAAQMIDCTTDRIGVTTCLDGAGAAYRGKADPKGRLVWRDGRGNIVTGYTNPDGVTVLLGPDGARVAGYEDAQGNSAWRTPNGRTIYGHSDPTNGNSVYRDNAGRVLRCHDDGKGHKVCISGREDR
ncbi:MAG: hypothetical protein ACK4YQ_16500 [Phenylobacterium sp.]|uniref:hypothetical protein n=1 Tax=Phenylobacterium sp. TaxID=1871053 RepID=UPI0039189A1C